jgi:hypothetical protein
MELIKQTNSILGPEINRYGCRFMCLIAIPQFKIGQALSADQISDIFSYGKKDPSIIGFNARTGSNEHLLIQRAFETLGHPKAWGAQVGSKLGDTETFWSGHEVDWQYACAHWLTDGVDGHWCLNDNQGNELYDPDDGPVNKKRVDRLLYYATEV